MCVQERQEKLKVMGRAKRATVAGVLGVALAGPAVAFGATTGPGGYIGAGAGQSSMQDKNQALPGADVDDTDTGWKVFGGYMWNPYVGLELGYVDFGKFSAAGQSAEWKAKGVDLSVLGVWPLANQFSLFGKVGANRWEVDNDVSGFGSTSDNGVDVSYGVGAQYDFTRNFGANVQWERYANVGDKDRTGQSDLDLVSLNVLYKFPY